MELSRKSLLYRFMNLYCEPADNICTLTWQLMPMFFVFLILTLGTIGFGAAVVFGLYNMSLDSLEGANWALAYFSLICFMVIVAMIVALIAMHIAEFIEKKVKEAERKETLKVLNAAIQRLNPFKGKGDKICFKITYKD